ncbi:hypothetical protein LMA04_01900 [Pseudescherichia vulneris]|uniref:hypothetical protein n=1 Tax=Pseudescherichia vulneris TaxID=566 RepID=UPI002279FCBF|nr:hypothetical protein [Pseudescherichia vulneris]WAH52836.1 hypothetical protein LMA04_01900 [Pseudescherichia vulneris]
MKTILVVAVVVGLIGCTSKSGSNQQAKLAPEKQILAPQLLVKKRDSGAVVIKRDGSFTGNACLSRVYINGKPVADLDTSQEVIVYPSPGQYVISTLPKDFCAGSMSAQSAEVDAGSTLTFRIGYATDGDFGIYPSAH